MKKDQEEEKEDLMGNSSMQGGYKHVDLVNIRSLVIHNRHARIVKLARIRAQQDTSSQHAAIALPEPGAQQLVYSLILAQARALLVSSLLLDRQHALI